MVSRLTAEQIVAKYERSLEKERARQSARYQQLKLNPEYVERKRANSRAWRERKKAESAAEASVAQTPSPSS
jgi:uncharacterized protein YdiU (UPF0061 family)